MDFLSSPVWCARLYPRLADNSSMGYIGTRWANNKRLFRCRRGFCDSCWGLLGANKVALGRNLIRPLAGTLPDDFHETGLINIPLDAKRMVGRLPWGLALPLKPFFGVMGVAPPPAWGRITSLIPRAMGGNLDNKELIPGAKLYLPVFVPGALFSCGDGHGVQGDGEVCVTAIETALQGHFRLTLRRDLDRKSTRLN